MYHRSVLKWILLALCIIFATTMLFINDKLNSLCITVHEIKEIITLEKDVEVDIDFIKTKPPIELRDRKDKTIIQKIMENPFYETLQIQPNVDREEINLLVIVTSAPGRYDRRDLIRKTWWRECRSKFKKSVKCLFMTDNVKMINKNYKILHAEMKQYGDIVLQNLNGGVQFGLRMLYHMLFAVLHYRFDYFLRVDDDYFLCSEKLIYELPMPPLQSFHWGWVHKDDPSNIRRPEESIIMFSKDVVFTFLLQGVTSLYCHPLADQMIMIWSDRLDVRHIYRHDERLHHDPIVSKISGIKENNAICKDYIGLHGVYPRDMASLWKNRGKNITYEGNLFNNSISIDMDGEFCWECFFPSVKYEPKLCIEDFQWNTALLSKGPYVGRSGAPL